MKRKISLLLIAALLFAALFGNSLSVNAETEYEYTDQYDSDSLLSQYSTAEIAAMNPEFSDYLASELRALSTDIPVADYNFHKKDIGAIFFSVVCENPDIFYVFPTSFETTLNAETEMVLSIRPQFYFDLEDISEQIEVFKRKTNQILSGVDRSWNDVTKARYLHDILAHYAEYDTKYETISSENPDLYRVQMRIYTSYGAIVDNNAVCEGYVMAYKYLLSQVGIKSYYTHSIARRHAWNMVEINGKMYHVDITHDDPTYDNLGRVGHDDFLKSDDWFNNDGNDEHYKWITNLTATDTSYDNAWWNDINTMIYRYNGYDYYMNQYYTSSVYAALTRRNISTGATEVLKTIKTRWYIDGSTTVFWNNAFSYLTSDGTYLYYNDASSVYRYSISSGTSEKVYTKPSSASGFIYGIAFKMNGNLYVTIKKDPNDKDVIYKVNITVTEPTDPSSNPSGATDPSSGQTDPSDPSNPTNPSSEGPTDPSESNYTNPTESEPITAPSTEEPTAKPYVKESSLTLYKNGSASLSFKPVGSYKFSTSKKEVVSVTKNGVITAKKAGKAIITAKSSAVIFKITVTVKNPKLNVTKKTIKKKKSFTLKVIGGSGHIVFKTSNKRITINKKGKVVGRKKGKATITVSVCGLKLKCRVTVK